MTDYVRGIDQLPKDTRLAVTVGVFDGVHRGHQQVFRVLEETARRLGALPVAVTFDPHPDAVVTGQAPDMLMDRRERIERISRLLGGMVALQTFDEVFRDSRRRSDPPTHHCREGLSGPGTLADLEGGTHVTE